MGFWSSLGNAVMDTVTFGGWSATKNREFEEQNLDYQKALQQQVFEREDTAVQRRMNDLIKSGLNPNLAAGSAAGTGSVVGTSAPQQQRSGIDVGQAIDIATAKQQLIQAKENTKAMQIQNQILDYQKQMAAIDKQEAQLDFEYNKTDFEYDFNAFYNQNDGSYIKWGDSKDAPYYKSIDKAFNSDMLDYQQQLQDFDLSNQNELMKWLTFGLQAIGTLGGLGHSGGRGRRYRRR